jgi:hypothetical protein
MMADIIPISFLPIIVLLVVVGIAGIIVLMWYLSRTKAATTEARIGQFEIDVLPSGDRVSGLTSLARSLVKQEYLQVLAQAERITDAQAKQMNKAFDDLFLYAMRGKGRGKQLIVSTENIEDPKFSIPLGQVFELPFGYVTRRLVVADGMSAERQGWKVYTIHPRNVQVEILGAERKTMTDIGEAAASVKEAAIRLQKEMPWKEVAAAREKQLHEAHERIAEISHENSDLKLALANKPLLEAERPPEIEVPSKGMSIGRLIFTAIVGVAFQISIIPYFRPEMDPLPYTIAAAVVSFIAWPWVYEHILKRWF